MPLAPPTSRAQVDAYGQMLLAWATTLGEAYPSVIATTAVTLGDGRIYTDLIGVQAGQAITNVQVVVQQLGTGTVPTNIVVGLADTSGNVLAVSGELKASAIWTTATGVVNAPLSAVYTPNANGAVQAWVIEKGAFGTQVLRLAGLTVAIGQPLGAAGATLFRLGNTATAQAVPTVGNPLPAVTASGLAPWFGLS